MHTCTRALGLLQVLDFARHQDEMASALRRVQRHEFRHPLTVLRESGRDGRAVSCDISEIGMGLFAPFACDTGEVVNLRINLRDVGTMEITAIVTRVRMVVRGLWEIGCMFRRWDHEPSLDEMGRMTDS